MKKLLIFAGTYEGRKLASFISQNGGTAYVCVATEYGSELMEDLKNITVLQGRINQAQMEKLVCENGFEMVIDATHPYATDVGRNIVNACNNLNVEYVRLLRGESASDNLNSDNIIITHSTAGAVEYLKGTSGNVLLTTGSKELVAYCEVPDFETRIFCRILPDVEGISHCKKLGYSSKNIIAMQGPFTKEINIAMLRQYKCKYLVTKSTGTPGGIDEKIDAALEAGAKVVLIQRPVEETGKTYEEVCDIAAGYLGFDINCKKCPEIDAYTLADSILDISCVNTVSKESACGNPAVKSGQYLSSHGSRAKIHAEYFFPLFVKTNGQKVLVAGGGKVATRRVKTLINFNFDIVVLSPVVCEELTKLAGEGQIKIINGYLTADNLSDYINSIFMFIAATDNREINHISGEYAKKQGIYASIADAKDECSFYFPAVVIKEGIVAAISAGGKNHRLVKEVAEKIRNLDL